MYRHLSFLLVFVFGVFLAPYVSAGPTECSLREAIDFANGGNLTTNGVTVDTAADENDGGCTVDGSVPANAIHFNIPGAGVQTITLGSSVFNQVIAPVTIDGTTQPSATCGTDAASRNLLIEIDASATTGGPVISFVTGSEGSSIRGISVYGSTDQGIDLFADDTTVTCTHAGADAAGTAAVGNGTQGIFVEADNILIGGTTFADANVISGNGCEGIAGNETDNLRIYGNLIGTDITGLVALGNQEEALDLYGNNAHTNLMLGGPTAAHGNVLSGNGRVTVATTNCGVTDPTPGVSIGTEPNPSTDILVQNNIIGLGSDGDTVIANGQDNLNISGTDRMVIRDNVISGSPEDGISTYGINNNLEIYGNLIGTDITGTKDRGNGGQGIGMFSEGSVVRIGSVNPADRNIVANSGNGTGGDTGISTNGMSGTELLDDVIVAGNYVGSDITGTQPMGNRHNGIFAGEFATNVTIGGPTAAHANIVVDNGDSATFQGTGIISRSPGAIIQNNLVGVQPDGVTPLGNNMPGIVLQFTSGNQVLDNVSSGNFLAGIVVMLSSDNVVQGNYVGTDKDGNQVAGLENGGTGVYLLANADNNLIGGTDPSDANIIAYNTDATTMAGLFVSSMEGALFGGPAGLIHPADNAILGNSIFGNTGLGIDHSITNGSTGFYPDEAVGVNVNDIGDADTGPNDFQNYPVLYDIDLVGGGSVDAHFYLDSTVAGDYRVEFFRNTAPDDSGHGEGQEFLDAETITHTGSGVESFTANVLGGSALVTGDYITMTATEIDGASSTGFGATSEFSPNAVVESLGPDFGDAPDKGAGTSTGNYNTVSSDNGAYHIIGDLYLGQCVDADDGTLEDTTAEADDHAVTIPRHGAVCSDDEDGVFFPTLAWGQTPSIDVIINDEANGIDDATTANAIVDVWIDLNTNGSFEDAGEHIIQSGSVTEGAEQTIPDTVTAGSALSGSGTVVTYARVRLAGQASDYPDFPARPLGEALIGEVEDYQVTIIDPGTASIGDTVTDDDTTNPLPGVIVQLYLDDGDGTYEPGTEDSLITSQVTDAAGNYDFTDLPAGNYWTSIGLTQAALTGKEQLSGTTLPQLITLTAAQDYNDADYGFRDLPDTDNDGDPDVTDPDDDGDGNPDTEENLAPGGDGNGDGIEDSLQSSVATATNPETDGYATLQSTGGCNVIDQYGVVRESSLSVEDPEYDYPVGLNDFTLECANPGDSAQVTVFYDDVYDTTNWVFRKFNATGEVYSDISSLVTYGTTTVGDKTVTTASYTVTDGDNQTDTDGVEDGTIIDPSGPAFLPSSATCAGNPITIGNEIYNDLNCNGDEDGNEDGFHGIAVELRDTNDREVDSDKTNEEGKYDLIVYEPGRYKVVVDKKDVKDFLQTEDPGSDVKLNNEAWVTVTECGESIGHIDFGYAEKECTLATTGADLMCVE